MDRARFHPVGTASAASMAARSPALAVSTGVAPGTVWLMSAPVNLYALAFAAARATVQADQHARHRRMVASLN